MQLWMAVFLFLLTLKRVSVFGDKNPGCCCLCKQKACRYPGVCGAKVALIICGVSYSAMLVETLHAGCF